MPGTIKYLDLTLPSPEENLALDEALLDACEAGGEEVLRFWESPRPFVVVGYGRSVVEDVDRETCAAEGVPILRRCSGGGTVLQGPGCLNYTLALRSDREADFRTISGANRFIMARNAAALAGLTSLDVRVEGHTDLAVGGLKFSGNAQRRKRHALLFHGTMLLTFELAMIERFLRLPKLQPKYRGGRAHQAFLRNLAVPSEAARTTIQAAWRAETRLQSALSASVASFVTTKYSRDEWNLRM